MNKAELIKTVAKTTGLRKDDVETVTDAIFNTIAETLKTHEKVGIVGFGTFDTKHKPEAIRRNPQTQEEVTVAEHYKPTFKYGTTLANQIKDSV